MKFRERHLIILFVCFCGFMSSPIAWAKIHISSIQGASNTSGLDTETPVIYGGVAGSMDEGTCIAANGVDTCNSCADNGAADNSRFRACNPSRIYSTLQLKINFTSDNIDNGYPVILTGESTSSGSFVTNSCPPASTVPKSQEASICITWSTICALNSSDINCENVGLSAITGGLIVGMSKDNDGKLSESGDDSITIRTYLVGGIGQVDTSNPTSIQTDCDNAQPNTGLCYFEVNPGDSLVTIKNIKGPTGFPQSSQISFLNALFYFSKNGYNDIKVSGQAFTLPISTDSSGGYSLSKSRITGLENDVTYYFKVAVQDQAMNIGYFTADEQDEVCTDGTTTCHIATPGQVLGVLDKSQCFIATAAYGSPMAHEIQILREFRRRFLLQHEWGKKFVRFYIQHSPPLADWLRTQNQFIKATVRLGLWPAIAYSKLALHYGFTLATFLFATLTLTFFALVHFLVRKIKIRFRKEKQKLSARSFYIFINIIFLCSIFSVSLENAIAQTDITENAGSAPDLSIQSDHSDASKASLEEIEKPSFIDSSGAYYYGAPRGHSRFAGSLRFAMMDSPTLTNPATGAKYKDIYEDDYTMGGLFDIEWKITKALGHLGIKFTSGVLISQGEGQFVNPSALGREGKTPDTHFTFIIFPNTLSLVYRLQITESQFLVPFVEGGGTYFTYAETRDDGLSEKLGSTPSATVAGGLHILLDWLDETAAHEMDIEYGISHIWLTAEYRHFIGLDPNADRAFSANCFSGGFRVDF